MENKIYQLGPDEFDEYDLSNGPHHFDWLVYHYTAGSYEGSGVAVWKVGDVYGMQNLSHCSCYGPMDSCDAAGQSIDAILKDLSVSEKDYDYVQMKAVGDKVKELIGNQNKE